MLERYIEKNGKRLRCGYTTGSCAAAATKAACQYLLRQAKGETIIVGHTGEVSLMTPKGWLINIPYKIEAVEHNAITCSVEKDSGDDIDATKGMEIFSKVTYGTGLDYNLQNGVGVGTVTKPGLSVPVGHPAINPVPQKMIREAVEECFESAYGIEVEISAPQGVEIAKRTFNPKLGVIGGVSIIGTSGIVEPMSEEALIDTLKVEVSVLSKQGVDVLLLSPGNYGRDFSMTLNIPTEHMIKTSNFIGSMLDEAERVGIKKILWVGHIGKMIKVAGGIFHTHSRMADGRMEILAAHLGLLGGSRELIHQVMEANTTDDAIDKIKSTPYMHVFTEIAERVSQRSMQRVFDNIEVGTILFSNIHGLLGMDERGRAFMERLKNE